MRSNKSHSHGFFLASCLGVLFFFSPLSWSLTLLDKIGINRGAWDEPTLLIIPVLLLMYGYAFVHDLKIPKHLTIFCTIVTSIVTSTFLLTPLGTPTGPEIVRLLFTIWALPLIALCIQTFGRSQTLLLLTAIICIHALWGIAQFTIQGSLHLYPLGETRLDPHTPGIARFAYRSAENASKVIRAYGPYPHPNSFAGSLIAGLLLVLSAPRRTVPLYRAVISFVLFLALLLTFTRSAWLSLVLLSAALGVNTFLTHSNLVRQFAIKPKNLIVPAIALIVFIPLLLGRFTDPADRARPERLSGAFHAVSIIKNNAARGVGIGNYRTSLRDLLEEKNVPYASWHLVPVHNVPLLITAEWGMVLTIALSAYVIFILRRYRTVFLWALLPLMPLLLLDHYLATQTAPLLWWLAASYILTHPISSQLVAPT